MSHIVAQIAYDGTEYLGWQETKSGNSVCASLARVLSIVLQESVVLQAASRTDKGVHAIGQIVDFTTQNPVDDLRKLHVSLNQLLPPDIRCIRLHLAPKNFHPTLSATAKTYSYNLSTSPVQLPSLRFTHWHIHQPLDVNLLASLPPLFMGTHDFRGLCNRRADLDEENTTRTVHSLTVLPYLNAITIEITGNSFLYKMVRNIVGSMVWIAKGKIPPSAVQEALATRKRACAGMTAPAHGLTLTQVHYPLPIFPE